MGESTNRLCLARLAMGLVVGLCPVRSPAAVCDLDIDLVYNLYVVSVDGEPFKGKRYIAYEDVLLLRDVLVETGECALAPPGLRCELVDNHDGTFAVHRGGVNFTGPATFTSEAAASKFAAELLADQVCAGE